MEQRDYILREIEKIGLILTAIRRKLFGGKDGADDTLADNEADRQTEMQSLYSELGIDLDKFLLLDTAETDNYLSNIKGMNIENIELLADCFAQMGTADESALNNPYSVKALQLYHLCNLKSSTYSFSRERKILMIENCESSENGE